MLLNTGDKMVNPGGCQGTAGVSQSSFLTGSLKADKGASPQLTSDFAL